MRNANVPYPRKRLVVNLAPASVRKEGPAYDLPIALGVLNYCSSTHTTRNRTRYRITSGR